MARAEEGARTLGLDPLIHQPTRLAVMAALYRNRQAAFTALARELELTPGNLASHAARLEEAGYVAQGRVLAGLHFEVRLRITAAGNEAFRRYLDALKALVAAHEDASGEAPQANL